MADETVNTVSLKLKQGYEFETTFENFPDAPVLVLDEPPPLGTARGPNASAMLGAAVGNCLAASLLFCMQRSRAPLAGIGARVAVHIARSETGRLRISGIDVTIEPEMASGQDPAKLDRCRELFEDFCTVTQSIRNGIPVEVTVTPREP
jgi:uncharacterized OsmC-like protein